MKVDLQHLANARAQSFNSLLSQISNARKTIADASVSHKGQLENDGDAAVTAWIKHVEAKICQALKLLLVWRIVDAHTQSRLALGHFL